jgi:outer membrane protein
MFSERKLQSLKFIAFLLGLFFQPFIMKGQDSLSLADCIRVAMGQNITIQKTELTKKQSNLDLWSKKAAFLPSINGTASRGYTFGKSLDYASNTFSYDQSNSDYFGLNSQLTLFNSFKQLNALKSSQFSVQSSEELYKETTDQICMTVASQYLQILLNTEQVKNAENQLLNTKNLLERTKLLVQVGSQNITKELELNAQFANDEMALVEAKNQLAQSYLTLKQTLNWDLGKPLNVKMVSIDPDRFTSYQYLKVDDFIDQSIQNLPTVKKAKLDLESSKYNYKSLISSRYPSISLQGSMNTRYSTLSKDQFTNEIIPYSDQLNNNLGKQVSFNLSIPIFNNYQASYSIQSAKINYDNSRLTYKEAELSARNTVYESWFLMNNAYQKYLAADNSLKAQQLLYEQTNSMYEQGVLNFYDWQQAKTNFNKAQNTYIGAKYEYTYRVKIFDYYRGIPINIDK